MSFKERLKENWKFLTDFSTERKTFFEKMAVVLAILVINLVYVSLVILFLRFILSHEIFCKYSFWGWLNGHDIYTKVQGSITRSVWTAILFAVILAPLWEEYTFRRYWLKKKLRKIDKDLLQPEIVEKLGKIPIWEIVVFTSIIFGLAHGGPINLLIQGVGGLLLAYAYLRNGRCFWSAVALHALYNGVVIFFVYTNAWKGAVAGITMPYWVLFQ